MKRSRIIYDILVYTDLMIYIVTCSSHWAQKYSMLLIQLYEQSILLDFGPWANFWVRQEVSGPINFCLDFLKSP